MPLPSMLLQTVAAPGAADAVLNLALLGALGSVGAALWLLVRTLFGLRDGVRDLQTILVGHDGKNGLKSEVQRLSTAVDSLNEKEMRREERERVLGPDDVGALDRRTVRREA